MSQPFDDPEEKPLDPAVERVQRRLRRLMLISGLTLGLGMFAVFGAILYRLTVADTRTAVSAIEPGAAAPSFKLADFGLAADARLVATALDGERLALTYDEGGASTVVIVDMATMKVVSRLRIAPQ